MHRPKYSLTLFIAPENSGKALANLYSALSGVPYTDYELEMIDITQDSVKAQQSGVTMSPALIYHSSEGDKRILHVTRAEVRRLLGIEEESLNI